MEQFLLSSLESIVDNSSTDNAPEIILFLIDKCIKPNVLKWDGDVIATKSFYNGINRFLKNTRIQGLYFTGANLHPDKQHLIAPAIDSLDSLQSEFIDKTSSSNQLASYTDYELRLFHRKDTQYDDKFLWCERLSIPFMDSLIRIFIREKIYKEFYIHLKYCKTNPFSNFSDDCKKVISNYLDNG